LVEKKKNMYEILGVSPTASPAEMKSAHRRLSLEIMSGKHGLSREDSDYRLQLLDVALNTLSDPSSRDAYDRQLAAVVPPAADFSARPAAASPNDEGRALQLAAVVEDIYKTNISKIDDQRSTLGVVSQSLSASGRSLKLILRIVGLLLLLGMVLRTGGCVMAARKAEPPRALVAKAEDKLIVQAYYKKHGVRVANRAEVEALEAEARRADNERREAAFKQRKIEDDNERFIEESRQSSLRMEREQERADAEARYEAMRRQRESQARQAPSEQ
jgi:curved DNA-binding protein CbpA